MPTMTTALATRHEERVTHILDPTAPIHISLYLSRIGTTCGDGSSDDNSEKARLFKTVSDIDCVMDYPNTPGPPPGCFVINCESPDRSSTTVKRGRFMMEE
eukprot:768392_1